MSQRQPIVFNKSMTADKRNQDFCYLRKNVFDSKEQGLYPGHDFVQEAPNNLTTTQDIVDILGSEDGTFDIKVIIQDGADVKFRNLGSNSESNTTKAGLDYVCGTFSDDGVKICLDDGKLYTVNHQNSNTVEEGTFLEAEPDIAGFDGLYSWWLSRNEIYKATDGAPTVAFNNIGLQPLFVDFLNDQMIIFCQEAGSIIILFWDKSDTDLFDKRIVIKNANLLAGGVNGGVLQVVYGVGNSANPKERNGEIVVANYDGEKFVEQNSIKAGDDVLDYEATTSVGIGSKVMLFSVDSNVDSHNTELYQDYVYKVHPSGEIEVQYEPDLAYGGAHVVRVFYNFVAIAQRGAGTNPSRVLINEDTNDNYADYEEYTSTVYITNFYNNPRNRHRLEQVGIVFEKLFEQTDPEAVPPTGEELDIYYRASERDSFVLLGNVTVEKVKENINSKKSQQTEYESDTLGLPEQVYKINKMPDMTALPEYHEIQFKFVSKRGFSIIDAWFDYDYVTRA